MNIKSVLFAMSCGLLLCGCNQQKGAQASDPEYAVEEVKASEANLTTSYPATLKGQEVTDIAAKVSGHIVKVYVKEGATVHKGQALFAIDPTQYQAAMKQAEAAVKVAQTSIATQKLTLENKKMLHDKQIISDYDYQLAQNQLATLEAQLMQAQAAYTSARDQLSFCTVTSPANGVIGEIPFRVGSLVGPSLPTPLTTVANTSTMYAYFSMTEKQLLSMSREHGSKDAAAKSFPDVQLKLVDGTIYDYPGTVEAISGVIQATTGSVQIRADFKNPQNILRSGGTATIIIPSHVKDAILVPQKATWAVQDKHFVYLLDKDNVANTMEITILPEHDGTNFVVTSGLKVGDRIVTEGVAKLKNGTKIVPITPAQSAAKQKKAQQHMAEKKMPGQE